MVENMIFKRHSEELHRTNTEQLRTYIFVLKISS